MNHSRSLLAMAILALPGLSQASGFSLNEQGTKSLGTALAGRASTAADATTVYSNPAGMSRLAGTQMSGNLALIDAPADIENPSGTPATGTNNGDMVPLTVVGSSFATKQINDSFHAGIGVYAPFGLSTNYEDSFQGRYFGDKSKVKVVALQPTASLQLTPEVSVGLGLVISKIEGILSSQVSPMAPGSQLMIEGDDMGTSFNFGVLAAVSEDTRVGVAFHSRTS
ncbi:MAG TPA: outer membrane protein transport protein [Fluviicoccus sp.]|nr:outer membrane protein transport protein [Fluviicoccus sp.]